jgi:hypothetical protein
LCFIAMIIKQKNVPEKNFPLICDIASGSESLTFVVKLVHGTISSRRTQQFSELKFIRVS